MNSLVIVNRRPRGFLGASIGLREGDPLSPFFIILIVDGLSILMERTKRFNMINWPIIGRDNVKVSHLQFVNNIIFFSSSNEDQNFIFDESGRFIYHQVKFDDKSI